MSRNVQTDSILSSWISNFRKYVKTKMQNTDKTDENEHKKTPFASFHTNKLWPYNDMVQTDFFQKICYPHAPGPKHLHLWWGRLYTNLDQTVHFLFSFLFCIFIMFSHILLFFFNTPIIVFLIANIWYQFPPRQSRFNTMRRYSMFFFKSQLRLSLLKLHC